MKDIYIFKKFAEDFAVKAGEIMKTNFRLGMSKQWKSDNTPITETDTKINTLLIEEVLKKFPDHSVLAEEKSRLVEDSEYVWVCDPIDGTIPFSAGIPISTFSLALVKNGESLIGVILDPFLDRFFSAVKGEGAFLNGEQIRVSQSTNFRESIASYEMFAGERYNVMPLVDHLRFNEKIKLMTLASIVYPSALVAAGELLFTIFPHDTAHDAAAVKVMVEEAGGRVTDLFGDEQRYDEATKGFIASNGFVHDKLVSLSKKLIHLS